MGELTHKATRAAFGKAIELTLKHVEKDREKGLFNLPKKKGFYSW